MAIYEVAANGFRLIEEITFAQAKLREREDLQRLLRSQIEVVCPGTLIISEEFSEWEDSGRRIDLLGVDEDANLVVIELKRTESGGHMELQAIRYAAMVSAMTFDRATEVYSDYLKRIESALDARTTLLKFLQWDEADEDRFAQDVRIVLVSAEFSKELTTAVIWLNDREIDIRCIRMRPYADNGRTLVDIQQILPLPETADFQVKIKEKQQRERAARKFNLDFTKYDISVCGKTYSGLPKRTAIYTIVRHLITNGHSPAEIAAVVPWREKSMFRVAEGELNSSAFIQVQLNGSSNGGRSFDARRFHCGDGELFHSGGRTYAFTNRWGNRCIEAIGLLSQSFPDENISFRPAP